MTKWNVEAEYIQSCNCDYGCPCNFNGYPTHGNCEALTAYHIRSGKFGDTKLDGVTFAEGMWWPKAIHEGNGVGALYVNSSSTPAQRKATEEIWSGRHGGGVFEVFPKTWAKVHTPKTAKIDFHADGYNSWFTVEGIGEVRSTTVKNPVTKADFRGEVVLPGGINFKRAIVTSVDWSLHDGEFQFDYRNRAGFVTVTKYSEKGPLSSSPELAVPKAKGASRRATTKR